MKSVVIKGSRYRVKPEEADKHGPFDRIYLAEGDSWMDASALALGSLPFYLTEDFNQRGRTNLIINISTSGQTLQRIEDVMKGDFAWWLRQFRYDGILFSAGGNDFIDAAREPPAGQGLLRDMKGQPLPADGYACVSQDALRLLRDDYLNPNFAAIYDALRQDALNAQTPLYLNSYDTPVARDAPALKGKAGPWLYAAYRRNSIDGSLWTALTAGLFGDIKATIEGWAKGRHKVQVVPTTGVLTMSDPAATGSSGDWKNEIHPNESGWRKQAKVWAGTLP